jgi:tetratricopeptide (TPR) repeat protein
VKRPLICKTKRITLIFLVTFVFGCAALPQKPTGPPVSPVGKDPFAVFPERYRNKALEYEKIGELRRALQCWEIVSSFIPTDGEVTKRMADLKAQIHTTADQHFKKGLSYYQNNSLEAAREEFLLALIYNPDHKEALDYVKEKLTGEDHILYEVEKGDTLKEIAKKKYNDSQKDFLIAYFNNLGKDVKLAPKTVLKIPILEPQRTEQASVTSVPKEMPTERMPKGEKEILINSKEMLGKAQGYFKVKNYREAASSAEEILAYDPGNRDARDLSNASYYQMGKTLSQEKKFQEALEVFEHVEPGYKDLNESVAFVKKRLADAHYIKGVEYFTNEELNKAIKEWEETLSLDPNHQKAKEGIENARALLEKLKQIK